MAIQLGAEEDPQDTRKAALHELADHSKILGQLQQFDTPDGTILAFAGKWTKPDEEKIWGWRLCNGAVVTRDDYPVLWQRIGTSWGHGTSANELDFNLPDLQGMFLRGVDHGYDPDNPNSPKREKVEDPDWNDRDPRRDGGNTNDSVGSYQPDGIGSHEHGILGGANSGTGDHNARFANYAKATNNVKNGQTSGTKQKSETRPKNVYVNWIIKVRELCGEGEECSDR